MKRLAALLFSTALLSASTDEERRLRLDFAQVTARATALLSVVRDTEDSLRRQGFSLHPNIVTARVLVESSMDDAEAALRDRDWAELSGRLSRARGCLEILRRKM